MLFQNNTILFPSGGNGILVNNNVVIEGNDFSRSATDKIVVTANNISWLNLDNFAPVKIRDLVNRHLGRQLAVQFSKNFVIQNNIFDVVNGVLTKNLNDGETILDEGGATSDLQDVGTTTAASSTSVTGQSKTWDFAPSAYNAGSRILMVSGAGADSCGKSFPGAATRSPWISHGLSLQRRVIISRFCAVNGELNHPQ